MLKNYMVGGKCFQFEEGQQPAGAVEVNAAKPSEKAAQTEDKAARPANRAGKVKTK